MRQPYYHDERSGIVIYHGDCRDVLPTLEHAEVSVVIVDPPFGINWTPSHEVNGVAASWAYKTISGDRADHATRRRECWCDLAVKRLRQEVFAFAV